VVRNGLRAAVFGVGYDGALDLRFMPVNTDVENGDLLVTSGIDGVYPAGLPVAVVSNIERNAAYPFAKITCTPAAGPERNTALLILMSLPEMPPRPPEEEPVTKPSKKKDKDKEKDKDKIAEAPAHAAAQAPKEATR